MPDSPKHLQIGLRQGFWHLLRGSLAGRSLSFGLNLLLSRSLGPTGLGLFSLVLTTCQTFELTARGGVDYGLSCELTGTATHRSREEQASFAEAGLRIIQLSTLVLAIGLWVWIVPLQGLLPIGLRVSRGIAGMTLVVIAALESLGGLPWDLLLIAGKTKRLALRQGLFAPLKLLLALVGASFLGIGGALSGYALGSALQLLWLQKQCGPLWPWPHRWIPNWRQVWTLIHGGLALYGTNALASLVFLPLVAKVAQDSGVAEVGYLRVGQIMVQLFTLIPGALAPLLFLKLREEPQQESQQRFETSLKLIWWIGLTGLFGYMLLDQVLVKLFFGDAFLPSLQPTRLLVLAAVLDSVNQVLHTPLLAKRRTTVFAISQNSGAVFAAALGWYLIPSMGLEGFLAAKLCFSTVPVGIYLLEAWCRFKQRRTITLLLLATIAVAPMCWWPSAPGLWVNSITGFVAAVLIIEGKPVIQHLPRR